MWAVTILCHAFYGDDHLRSEPLSDMHSRIIVTKQEGQKYALVQAANLKAMAGLTYIPRVTAGFS